jgi:predicted outer membrane protein
MISEHEGLDDKLEASLAARRVTPQESELSADVRRTGETMREKIRRARGADFDAVYLDVQIYMHRRALTLFDRQLLPQTEDPELRARLEEARASVKQHLGQATILRKRFPQDLGRL